ncbi:MAG: DNA methylase [Armatimonadetes bacterium]|nr:DNA methylase [Armatimonadota bacterium]
MVPAASLPTNATAKQHPIHRWFNFIAGFSPEFVYQCCQSVSLGPESVLLDPFAGCATAPVVACQLGITAVGFEPHPVFLRIARAKLPSPHWIADLPRIEAALLEGFAHPADPCTLPPAPAAFLGKLFPDSVLRVLLGGRRALDDHRLSDNDLAFLILSCALEQCCHSQTDGIYKALTTHKASALPPDACAELVARVRADLLAVGPAYPGIRARMFPDSSESMHALGDASVSIVVTSPPYLDNFDYAEMTRMYLYFWGIANSWQEITEKVRATLVTNTTTALAGHRHGQEQHRDAVPSVLHPQLDSLVAVLAERRKTKAGKKDYHLLVYPYFAQMTRVLRECSRVMRPGAPIHIMVADSALYGVHVASPQFLARILSEIGFRSTAVAFVRGRGHRWALAKRAGSPTGLAEFHVCALR